ncbi:hypothetical protein M408DRAFT_329184 [Serendipita vermifera MAFF 305830]|uniref:Uncharacterized protein n=1 Tax=Serendipita vermifera MAFF 305830 TaxID=933852 RepID=A0A0C3B9E8_SERVB|nr:hypothetical protein M408DRAFT_329184 [Serendipita vermifera MAFF 305830]
MAADGKATTTSGGMTIVISEFVTTVNGVETIFATPVQTLLNTSDGFLNHSQRTGVIAGAAVGGVIVLVALLGLLFYFRRTRQVRQRLLEEKRAKERPPRHLLEDEADDYSFGRGPPMMAQHWDSTSFTSGGSSPSAPRLLRARGSKTGSLFQEDVWPPPSEVMQDPLLTAHDIGSSLSLAIGLPVEGGSTSSQADVSQTEFKQPSPTNNLMSSADAYAFGAAPVGAGHPMQRSSAYESIRSNDSADYYYHAHSHSRAESAEPLLDDAGRGSVSPPPMASRNLAASPTNTLDRRARRSNLRVSYTADDFQHVAGSSPPRADHSRAGTGHSVGSISPRNEHLVASPVEGISTGRTEEVPPMYHTIPRDAV